MSGPVWLGLEAFYEGWGTNSELGKVKVEVEVQLEGTMQGYRESDDAGGTEEKWKLKTPSDVFCAFPRGRML